LTNFDEEYDGMFQWRTENFTSDKLIDASAAFTFMTA
jgi:hypothetical protein